MEKYKWSRQQIVKIIELLKRHNNLYDPNNEKYTDKSSRTASFLQIYEKLKEDDPKITTDIVRKKLHILRTQYTKEYRMLQDANKYGKIYVPTLWCFERMNFLDCYFKKKRQDEKLKETVLPIQKKPANLNILQQLKMDIHERVLYKAERKYEWLGQLIVAEVNKIQNEEFQEAMVWEIQKVLHEAQVKDRLLSQANQLDAEVEFEG